MKISGVKGMNDVLPADVAAWQHVEAVARQVFAQYGYREVRTPVVEPAALYARSVGEATDIVKKEMYVFEDKGEEVLALRPEGTAGTVRAFIEHGCHVEGLQKWFYVGPMFRRERPQKGRYRQFHQLGVEVFGAAQPAADAEQIAMVADLLGRLGVAATLKLNSVGDEACRPQYLVDLTAYLRANREALCADCKERIERNPLRVLDCKVPTCQPVLQQAPRITERLCAACKEHFDAVKSALDALGVAYQLDHRLVRGLDYYTRTAYEFVGARQAAQNAIAGGGRYDKLVEVLGGPATPGIGFGMGEERLIDAMKEAGRAPKPAGPELFFVSVDEAGARAALELAVRLRRAGVACDLDPRGGKTKTQFKQAERVGAKRVVVLGGNEVQSGEAKMKDLASGSESPVRLSELASVLSKSAAS